MEGSELQFQSRPENWPYHLMIISVYQNVPKTILTHLGIPMFDGGEEGGTEEIHAG